jgi:hypothetical protein
MNGATTALLVAAGAAAGWFGHGYYSSSWYVDGPCFVSALLSDPARGKVSANCVMGDAVYGTAQISLDDAVRTAIDDPRDTRYLQATIWIEGEALGSARRVWIYDVKNLVEEAIGRERIHPAGM